VQIFDKDQTQLYATLLAIPADRVEAEGDPVITFKETPSDRPPAVHFWYYAGERSGNEFVYPKNQAMMIARASGESVMAVDTDSTNIDDWKNGQPTRVTADAAAQPNTTSTTSTTTSSDTTSASSAQPTMTTPPSQPAQPTTTAQPAQPTTTAQPAHPTTTAEQTPAQPTMTPQSAQPTTSQETRSTTPDRTAGTSGRSELPHTASELPVVGLIGVFAIAGALMLRLARRAAV
jgi:hypothetical protein